MSEKTCNPIIVFFSIIWKIIKWIIGLTGLLFIIFIITQLIIKKQPVINIESLIYNKFGRNGAV